MPPLCPPYIENPAAVHDQNVRPTGFRSSWPDVLELVGGDELRNYSSDKFKAALENFLLATYPFRGQRCPAPLQSNANLGGQILATALYGYHFSVASICGHRPLKGYEHIIRYNSILYISRKKIKIKIIEVK